MSDKRKSRPFSASRQRRLTKRSSSLDSTRTPFNPNSSICATNVILVAIDLRTPKQKIEDLQKEIIESKDESTAEQYLNQLVLMQVYTNLEYGDNSIENARAYVNLSKFYLNRKSNFLPQAKFHALNARQILEYLNIKPNDDNILQNLLAYDIYLTLTKCSINAKQYLLQRELKIKNKHILSIDKVHINHDFNLIKKYLDKLKHLMKPMAYEQIHMEYLFVKFDKILFDSKEFDESIYELIDQLVIYIEKFFSNDQIKRTIDLYLRSGSYLIKYDENIQDGLKYYRKAIELANEQEKTKSSIKHKHQLANAILQRSIAKDALNVLCESLPDKIQLFGDFSEEVIQTESRIGSIYLREGECLNAVEHLKTCLDLQEFVYGSNDSRTCETRRLIEFLKKDPMVSRTFFARTQDGIRQSRPVFRVTNKVSHKKEDLQLLQKVTKKPPISSKT
ncbi:unnamed protein product [Rotaria sp. Silwood2]|nr:unnamed protein product [Rotaria sp. Silwood2]